MLRPILLLVFLLFAVTMESSGQDRSYGRSVVMTDRGIVATSHYLASQAGAQILAKGGTAMDAAIAANAVLGVTEPMNNGIGGDLVSHLLGREERQTLWPELERLGAAWTFRGVSGETGNHVDAWGRDPHGHGSRRCRRMEPGAPTLRAFAVEGTLSSGNLLR